MTVFERFLAAQADYIDTFGRTPDRVYVSPATAARMTHELNSLRIQDVPTNPPAGLLGWFGGCEWHEDPAKTQR